MVRVNWLLIKGAQPAAGPGRAPEGRAGLKTPPGGAGVWWHRHGRDLWDALMGLEWSPQGWRCCVRDLGFAKTNK